MEGERSLGGDSSSSSRVMSSYEKLGERTRFTVELRPGETTIVSWKKLVKDVSKDNGSVPSSFAVAATSAAELPTTTINPALESRLAPGQPSSNELKDAAAPNRFNAVIEKIERLYMGKDSSDDEDLDDIPDDDQYDTDDSFIDDAELDEYFEVDKLKTKHDGFFVNRGKLESIEPSLSPNVQPKKRRKEMMKATGESDYDHAPNKHLKMGRKGADKTAPFVNNSFPTSVSTPNPQNIGAGDSGQVRYQEKSGSGHLKLQPGKTNNGELSEISFHRREKNDNHELIDLNVAASNHPTKAPLFHKREGSSFKSKSTMLDKAIRELEKMVAQCRPPVMDLQDADATSHAMKRRLPGDVKQKLAKVARLAQVSHGKVSKELLSRLMSILGHLVNVRTLKRNLKIMINSSLSVNQEKDVQFQHQKRELVEMIKAHAPSLTSKASERQPGGADDFQESCLEEKGLTKVKYKMDTALEDKICDLYDIFVDGLDEDVAPQARKLYSELAELWPKGAMDNHGIKRAICHSKERRRTLHDLNKVQGGVKRKKLVATKMEETVLAEPTSAMQPQYVQEGVFTDLGAHAAYSENQLTCGVATNTTTAIPTSMSLGLPVPPPNSRNSERPKHKKSKGSTSSSYVEIMAPDGTLVKKKVKSKPETDQGEAHSRPEKFSLHNEDRQKSHKQQSAGSPVGGAPPNSSIHSTTILSFEQLT